VAHAMLVESANNAKHAQETGIGKWRFAIEESAKLRWASISNAAKRAERDRTGILMPRDDYPSLNSILPILVYTQICSRRVKKARRRGAIMIRRDSRTVYRELTFDENLCDVTTA